MDIRVSLWGMCVCVFNSVNTVNWLIVSPWGDYVSYTYWIKKSYIYMSCVYYFCLFEGFFLVCQTKEQKRANLLWNTIDRHLNDA